MMRDLNADNVISSFTTDYGLEVTSLGETPEESLSSFNKLIEDIKIRSQQQREYEYHKNQLTSIIKRDVDLSYLGVNTSIDFNDQYLLDKLNSIFLCDPCSSADPADPADPADGK